MQSKRGFTLVEMLVVITIIGILIVALVPLVRNAQIRAKETAVRTQCAGVEAALATYAQNHNGNYPGVAIDVMAPFGDHALGDPDIYATGGTGWLAPDTQELVNGVLGGYGHYNATTVNVFEQIKTAKDTPLGGAPSDVPRYFDVLMASDATQEYPPNPFLTTSTGERARMRNIFAFSFFVAPGRFDPINDFTDVGGNYEYGCGLYVPRGGNDQSIATPDALDSTRVLLMHEPMGIPLPSTWTPPAFSVECQFGTDEGDYFAPGDFAYVPVLSTSAYPFGNNAATVENEVYKWGTNVSGYLFFGYGDDSHRNNEFEDEQREFVDVGLPGYGSAGVDTLYENYVLQLFEGAIYFSTKI